MPAWQWVLEAGADKLAREREQARETEYFTVRAQQPLTPIQGVYVCTCACVLAHSLQHQQEVSRSVEKQWQGGSASNAWSPPLGRRISPSL